MNEETRKKLAADAVRDLGITPKAAKGVMPFPNALREGSTASLAERATARDAYLESILNSNTATAEQKQWLGQQLAEFARENFSE